MYRNFSSKLMLLFWCMYLNIRRVHGDFITIYGRVCDMIVTTIYH
jgi:hypothetical protein